MSDPTDEIAALQQRVADLEAENASLATSARRTAHLSVACSNATTDRNRLEVELAKAITKSNDLQQQVERLTNERDSAATSAQEWYDWVRQMHPELFDDEGNWLKKPRKTKPNKTPDNSVAPDHKGDDVAPESTSTQVLPVDKPRKRLSFRNNKKVA